MLDVVWLQYHLAKACRLSFIQRAERAVREGVSLTYSGALDQGVIEIVATDLQDLFAQASGQTVSVRGAGEIELDLAGAIIERVEMSFADEFLSVITDPNIALLLMNLGFIGILVSFYQGLEPVTLIAGLICLIIGLYALNTLPLNYAGAALIMLGLGLLIAEIFFASYGLLALGGLIAFAVGALMLVDSDVEGLRIDWWMVAGATGTLGVAFFAAAGYGLAAQGRKVTTGRESLLNETGRVLSWDGGRGHVHVQGERWQAVSQSPLSPGATVEVTAVDGLILTVTPKPEEPPHA
jgi:membrane-bound serine protease (ClpP class)